MSTRLENLYRMKEKYEDGGHVDAARRVDARIKEVEKQEAAHLAKCKRSAELAEQSDMTGRNDLLAEAVEIHRLCDQCGKVPCQCDAEYDKHLDRMFFPDDY